MVEVEVELTAEVQLPKPKRKKEKKPVPENNDFEDMEAEYDVDGGTLDPSLRNLASSTFFLFFCADLYNTRVELQYVC